MAELVAVVRIAGHETELRGRPARMVRWIRDNKDRIQQPRVGQLQFNFSAEHLKYALQETEGDEVPS